MFGTIGHSRIKPGHEEQVRALNADWDREMRPTIPGVVWALWGTPTGRAGEIVNVIAVQDEATYRALAENPAQDAW